MPTLALLTKRPNLVHLAVTITGLMAAGLDPGGHGLAGAGGAGGAAGSAEGSGLG